MYTPDYRIGNYLFGLKIGAGGSTKGARQEQEGRYRAQRVPKLAPSITSVGIEDLCVCSA